MAMTEGELQEKIIRLGEETEALAATPEYQQWIAELKESIAEIDTHPGRPAEEFFAELIRELEDKKRAAKP